MATLLLGMGAAHATGCPAGEMQQTGQRRAAPLAITAGLWGGLCAHLPLSVVANPEVWLGGQWEVYTKEYQNPQQPLGNWGSSGLKANRKASWGCSLIIVLELQAPGGSRWTSYTI